MPQESSRDWIAFTTRSCNSEARRGLIRASAGESKINIFDIQMKQQGLRVGKGAGDVEIPLQEPPQMPAGLRLCRW